MSSVEKSNLIPHFQECKDFLSCNEKGELINPVLANRYRKIQEIIGLSEGRTLSGEEAAKFLSIRLEDEIKIISKETKDSRRTPEIKDRPTAIQKVKELKERTRHLNLTAKDTFFQNEIKKLREELTQKIELLESKKQGLTKNLEGKNAECAEKNHQQRVLLETIANQHARIKVLESEQEKVVRERDELVTKWMHSKEEVEGLKGSIHSTNAGKEALAKQLTELSGEIDALKTEKETSGAQNEKEFKRLEKEVEKKETEAKQLQQQISEKQKTINSLSADLKESKENAGALKQELEGKSQQIQDLSKQISEVSKEKDKIQDDLQREIADKQTKITKLESEKKELGKKLETTTAQKERQSQKLSSIQELHSNGISLIKSENEKEKNRLETKLSQLQEKLEIAVKEKETLAGQLEDSKKDLEFLQNDRISDLSARLVESENECSGLTKEKEELVKKLENSQREAENIRDRITEKESQIEELKEANALLSAAMANVSSEVIAYGDEIEGIRENTKELEQSLMLSNQTRKEDLEQFQAQLTEKDAEIATLMSEIQEAQGKSSERPSVSESEVSEMKKIIEEQKKTIARLEQEKIEAAEKKIAKKLTKYKNGAAEIEKELQAIQEKENTRSWLRWFW